MITAKRTSIIIQPYNQSNRQEWLEKALSVKVEATFSYKPVGLYYDEEREKLIIPRGVSIRELERGFNDVCFVDRSYDPVDKCVFRLKTDPRDDSQRSAIAFLLSKGEYENMETHTRRMLELDTGVGKTYCFIAAVAYLQVKSAVILHSNGLIEQWAQKLKEHMNANDRDIYVIAGIDSIKKILDGKVSAKVYLISHATIAMYARNNSWYAVGDLFKKLKIGIKCFDEAHLRLENVIKIDLFTNTKQTVYLTATARRSAYTENHLFSVVYGNVPKLSIKRTKEEAYVKAMIIKYATEPNLSEKQLFRLPRGMRGLNINNYMRYSVFGKGSTKFFKSIEVILNTILEKDGRVAILLSRLNVIKKVQEYIETHYPHIEVGTYTSDIKSKKLHKEQLEKKIILTTYKSFGTGLDIPNLRFLVMTEPYSSTVILEQMIGRLRDIGGDLYYFEILDEGVQGRLNEYEGIKKKMNLITEKVTEYTLP